jgi:glyoxylase-like metal-dependent hydrolase (beta-lactamase superfamily II)
MTGEVADRVYRLGAERVSWYLVEEGGRLTIVDAGMPSQFEQLPAALSTLGHTMSDVEAIVLTHAHGDHIGSAARIKEESEAEVHVHADDAALARGEVERTSERNFVRDLTRPYAWRSAVFFIRGGSLKAPPVAELSTFADGETLDVPGRPRVIHTPGHTDGSACIELGERRVLFTGDALVMLHIGTGTRGPRIMPRAFNVSSAKALASLQILSGVDADVLLPGHGEPWRGAVAEAIELATAAGPS